ncbi:MAG: nucleotidyltransferase domain-containing protein [Methylothermaceae bacterium]|nr:nucleotidyltransferase domain-containing protein [Methylothermaceae bacterium]
MRLNPEQIAAIKQATAEVFGPEASVRLFGSRIDDSRRGGDIDLYIETDKTEGLIDLKARLLIKLFRRLGAQRIDLVVRRRQQPPEAIHRDALEHGVLL